jgi:beta-glucosidase
MKFSKTIAMLSVFAAALTALPASAQEGIKELAVHGESFNKPESAQPFRYLWNAKGPIGKAENYVALPFVEKDKIYAIVDENGKPVPDKPIGRNWMCLPGLEAARDSEKTDRYLISAYPVAEDSQGHVWLINGNLQHPYGRTEKDAVLLRVFVNDEQKYELTSGFSKVPALFNCDLGPLKKGDTIYAAVGPEAKNEADLFKLFFTIADIPAGTEPAPPKNILFPPADTAHPKMQANGAPIKWYQNIPKSHNAMLLREKPDILFLGDSITAGWKPEYLKENFSEFYKTSQIGIGGDWTQNILWRVENGAIDQVNPRLIVLMIGTNNLGNGYTNAEVVAGNAAILKRLRAKSPESKILLLGVFPRGKNIAEAVNKNIKEINTGLAALADNQNIFFLDIGDKLIEPDGTISREVFHDGLHLSKEGYARWAQAILPELKKLAPPQAQ